MATVIIGADICPIEGNQPYFETGDAESLFHDLLPEFEAADLVVANLECPFIKNSSPIAKTGPAFGVPGSCVNGIRKAGIHALCLANNHIMDHGPTGLYHTLEICREAGIETIGAGKNLDEARRIFIQAINGQRVAIWAVAEHEFSIATRETCGANPLDLIEFVRMVKKEQHNFDHLIVLYHGAAEFQAPTPQVQRNCRFMIEMGATAVVVQHPHMLGGVEHYLNGKIIYGQGALVMDEAIYRNLASFHEGFLIKISFHSNVEPEFEWIPFIQSSPVPGARKLLNSPKLQFLAYLKKRAEMICDEKFVEREWMEFCSKRRNQYISSLLGHNRIVRKMNANGLIERLLYGDKHLLSSRNILNCETHREAVQTIFEERMRNKFDHKR